jgi:hypothetical protein
MPRRPATLPRRMTAFHVRREKAALSSGCAHTTRAALTGLRKRGYASGGLRSICCAIATASAPSGACRLRNSNSSSCRGCPNVRR